MKQNEFRGAAEATLDLMINYLENVEHYPVLPNFQPGALKRSLESGFPEKGVPFHAILEEFEHSILPGITHWQHPNFFAYFPANSSPPSILAEMLTATLGLQCMLWETSPAATELEEICMDGLRDAVGLPDEFFGVIQEGGSISNFCAILSARESKLNYLGNTKGLWNESPLTLYTSEEAHSSIDKAVRMAGIGSDLLRKIPTNERFQMRPDLLRMSIESDIAQGLTPFCLIPTLGTTSSVAIDQLVPLAKIAKEHGLWVHVDAAYAGNALVLPEYRWMIDGIDLCDSFVFNPHKWMFVNFDLSALFVREKDALRKTFSITPEYLRTEVDSQVNNLRDLGVSLGRRFRALKLWFVLKSYGLERIREMIRSHIEIARELSVTIDRSEDLELFLPPSLGNVCFRLRSKSDADQEKRNLENARFLNQLNSTGKMYLSQTKLRGDLVLRFCVGQTNTSREHVFQAFDRICQEARHFR